VSFLGHVIFGERVSIDLEKLKAIVEWGRSTSVHEIRSFLGLADYYCHSIEGFSKLSVPLTALTRRTFTTYGGKLVKKFPRVEETVSVNTRSNITYGIEKICSLQLRLEERIGESTYSER
jgi:hypothetical protein